MCPTKLCEVSPKDSGELSRQLPKRREPIAQILLGAHRIREPHTFNACGRRGARCHDSSRLKWMLNRPTA
jgi:hypothetical protein